MAAPSAAERNAAMPKGAIVEFDFAAMNGAELLFETTKKFLWDLDGIPFDDVLEARYMAGFNYHGAFSEFFPVAKTKKTAAKAALDLFMAFEAALNEAVPKSITSGFRNFVRALAAKGVKVVIATRAGEVVAQEAFKPLLGPNVVVYHEDSPTYGCVKWDLWLRACATCGLKHVTTVAVTGSGHGVRSALYAGMGSMAVPNPRTSYQDYTGANAVVDALNADAAKELLKILRV